MNCTAVRWSCGGGSGVAMQGAWTLPPVPWGDDRPAKARRWTPLPTEEPMTAGLILSVASAQGCGRCIGDVTRVDISGRRLVGGQPRDTFRDFVRLHTVLADGNRLTLEDFLGMPAIRDLSLCANHLDHIPPYRGPDDWFTHLEMLDISDNPDLPFRHLPILGHLRKLKHLSIRNCKLTRLPRALRLPTLLELDASGNPFGGHGCRVLLVASRQPALRTLTLAGCGLRRLPVLLTLHDANMLDDYSWGEENEPERERDTDFWRCWCHATEYQRAAHQAPDTCVCLRCRVGEPCADCGCRQRLPQGRGVCSHPSPEMVEWARTPRGQRATVLVYHLAVLAGPDGLRLARRNWQGDCDRGKPGSLFGVPVFVVPHEPFASLEELKLWNNPLSKPADVLAASTWPKLTCLRIGDTPLAESGEHLAVVTQLMHNIVSVLPNGVTHSSMALARTLEADESHWLSNMKDEEEEEEEEEKDVMVEDILEETISRAAEEVEKQAAEAAPVEFGAWRSSSSSSTSIEEPRPLTKEEQWQQRAVRHLRRHWDGRWMTRRPTPPPPGPRPCCRPGEPCLRRRPPPQPEPPTPEPEPLARCEMGGPCKTTLRRCLWKLAWGRLQHPPPEQLLRRQVEKELAGRDVASLFFCDEGRPRRCSCCAFIAD